MPRLQWITQDSNPSENGILLWDETNGYPVVSKAGEWQQVILGDEPMDFGVTLAERTALQKYGDTISTIDRAETLLKFGKNEDLDASLSEMVWNQGGEEVYATSNTIDTISSSDSGDTQEVTIQGHTVSGVGASAEFTFVTQTATLSGQSKVPLATPLARVQRAINSNSTAFAGDFYIYEDTAISSGVPSDASKIHMKILAGETQSYKAAFTVAKDEYVIVTGGFASINKKTAATVDFELQTSPTAELFYPASRITLNSAGQSTVHIPFYPYALIPPNTDVRVFATSDTNNTEVSASLSGFYANIIS